MTEPGTFDERYVLAKVQAAYLKAWEEARTLVSERSISVPKSLSAELLMAFQVRINVLRIQHIIDEGKAKT